VSFFVAIFLILQKCPNDKEATMAAGVKRGRTHRPEPGIPGAPTTSPRPFGDPDPTYRRLLGDLAWRRLPPAIRDRFAVKPRRGGAIRYAGIMHEVRRSRAGWFIAQACRLLGTPLVARQGCDVPVTVTLRTDAAGDGIVWERCYRFPLNAPVRAVSIKKASAEEGLLECVGGGFGMRLRVFERERALHFVSVGFFWRLGRWRMALPELLTPGRMHVVHRDLGGSRFRFTISVRHILLGETFHQDGTFAAAPPIPE
jgi:hypothetical protein